MSTFLLKAAEELREQHHRVQKELAYTAPELISDDGKQWIESTIAMIDLLEHVAASGDPVLIMKTETLVSKLIPQVRTS